MPPLQKFFQAQNQRNFHLRGLPGVSVFLTTQVSYPMGDEGIAPYEKIPKHCFSDVNVRRKGSLLR